MFSLISEIKHAGRCTNNTFLLCVQATIERFICESCHSVALMITAHLLQVIDTHEVV